MSNDVFAELREAVTRNDEWPTVDTNALVIYAARRFVQAVDMQAEVIEQHRREVPPAHEALAAMLAPFFER